MMRVRLRRYLAIAGCAAAMLVSVTAGVASAKPWAAPLLKINAGKANCPMGYACFWSERDYQGSGVAIYGTETNWPALPTQFN